MYLKDSNKTKPRPDLLIGPSMISRFLPKPKEDKFFQYFNEISVCLVQASQELTQGLKDLSTSEFTARRVREIESEADSLAHAALEKLHNSFITPFDRYDIHSMVQSLDNIIDLIHATGERLVIYNLTSVPKITIDLAEKAHEAILQVQLAVAGLSSLKKQNSVRAICSEIHRLENESDVLFRSSIAELFREENNIKVLISLKDINEILEEIADRCEDIAGLIESIVLEYT